MRTILIISLLSILSHGFSQSFTAQTSHNKVGVGQRFKISYTLDGADGSKFVQPTFTGFRMLSGPNVSSNMQWVNGNFTSSKSFSFILVAAKEGEFTIGPASIKVKGKTLKSESITIKVIQGAQAKSAQKAKAKQSKNSQESTDLSADLFLKLFLNKKQAYVGEQVIATYKLYLGAQVVNYANSRPVYNGFYAQEIDIDPNAEITTETINGRQFRVATMKKVVLTPQKSGEIEVPPLEMEMVVRTENKKRRRSIWDPWGGVKDVKVAIESDARTIKILPLPLKDQPSDFNGAVGSFKLNVSTDLSEVKVNEAVNMKVVIDGRGNIDLITNPIISFPQDFETYDPKIKNNVSVTGGGTSGKKTFEYVMIPRYAGDFELKPITMSYFDPKSESYKRLSTDPIQVSVIKNGSDGGPSELAYVAPKKEDIQVIGRDIRYIKSTSKPFQQKSEPFLGSSAFYAASSIPVAAMGLSILLIGHFRKRDADLLSVKSRKAKSMAKRRFSKAKKLKESDDSSFYEEIFRALYGYLSDKLSIEVSSLNKTTINEQLIERKVSSESIDELMTALDECEMARFAPGVVRGKEEMLASSIKIIERIEDEI